MSGILSEILTLIWEFYHGYKQTLPIALTDVGDASIGISSMLSLIYNPELDVTFSCKAEMKISDLLQTLGPTAVNKCFLSIVP